MTRKQMASFITVRFASPVWTMYDRFCKHFEIFRSMSQVIKVHRTLKHTSPDQWGYCNHIIIVFIGFQWPYYCIALQKLIRKRKNQYFSTNVRSSQMRQLTPWPPPLLLWDVLACMHGWHSCISNREVSRCKMGIQLDYSHLVLQYRGS